MIPKDQTLQIRLSARDMAACKAIAAAGGRSLSAWAREALVTATAGVFLPVAEVLEAAAPSAAADHVVEDEMTDAEAEAIISQVSDAVANHPCVRQLCLGCQGRARRHQEPLIGCRSCEKLNPQP